MGLATTETQERKFWTTPKLKAYLIKGQGVKTPAFFECFWEKKHWKQTEKKEEEK